MSESTVPAKSTNQDSVVTITRGTGSVGSTITIDLLDNGVRGINVFSRDDARQDAMRRRIDDPRVRYLIGDFRDADSVKRSVSGADSVFDDGALKQVFWCEFFPEQAAKTNVWGSYNAIEDAAKAGVRSVACLSTDKGGYPISAMGMMKALIEKTTQAFARNGPNWATTVSMTRDGEGRRSGWVFPGAAERQIDAVRVVLRRRQDANRLLAVVHVGKHRPVLGEGVKGMAAHDPQARPPARTEGCLMRVVMTGADGCSRHAWWATLRSPSLVADRIGR
jgi:hypothetical protein